MNNKVNYGHLQGKIVNINKVPFLDNVLAGNYFLGTMEVKRNERRCDYVPIIFSFTDLERHPMIINNGNFSINGSFRSLSVYEANRCQKFQVFYPNRIVDLPKDGQNLIRRILEKNNRINLIGRIEKADKMKIFNSKKEMINFTLDVSESHPKYDSSILCTAWGNEAKFINMLDDGEEISIVGCIQSQRPYSLHNENPNYAFEIDDLKNTISVLNIDINNEMEV